VRAVAGDFTVLGTEGSVDVLLHYSGIVAVRQEAGSSPAFGDRTLALDTTLGEVLVGLAGGRPQVSVVMRDGNGLTGQLRAMGRDVLTLRLDDERHSAAYVPLAAVAEITLNER
jgi:hypothetical protein